MGEREGREAERDKLERRDAADVKAERGEQEHDHGDDVRNEVHSYRLPVVCWHR